MTPLPQHFPATDLETVTRSLRGEAVDVDLAGGAAWWLVGYGLSQLRPGERVVWAPLPPDDLAELLDNSAARAGDVPWARALPGLLAFQDQCLRNRK